MIIVRFVIGKDAILHLLVVEGWVQSRHGSADVASCANYSACQSIQPALNGLGPGVGESRCNEEPEDSQVL